MLSRVADSIYWMSRYVERAENVARFISVNLNLSLDMPGEAGQQWWPLVVITGDDAQFQKRVGMTTKESVVQFLTFDEEEIRLATLSRKLRHLPFIDPVRVDDDPAVRGLAGTLLPDPSDRVPPHGRGRRRTSRDASPVRPKG